VKGEKKLKNKCITKAFEEIVLPKGGKGGGTWPQKVKPRGTEEVMLQESDKNPDFYELINHTGYRKASAGLGREVFKGRDRGEIRGK